jgi:hypothetical protein
VLQTWGSSVLSKAAHGYHPHSGGTPALAPDCEDLGNDRYSDDEDWLLGQAAVTTSIDMSHPTCGPPADFHFDFLSFLFLSPFHHPFSPYYERFAVFPPHLWQYRFGARLWGCITGDEGSVVCAEPPKGVVLAAGLRQVVKPGSPEAC